VSEESHLASFSRREFLLHHGVIAAASLLCSATLCSCERSASPVRAGSSGPAAPPAPARAAQSEPSTNKGSPASPVSSYVITGDCSKQGDCVDVCPVDCIHPAKGEPKFSKASQLYIDPVECIECGACVEVCPVSAIFASDDLPWQWKPWQEKNARYFGR